MFLVDVVNRGTTPALGTALAFTEARHKMIAENIANVDTPGYHTKHLDVGKFQAALGDALERRREDPSGAFELRSTDEFEMDPSGHLRFTPSTQPPENILFHDGTNGMLERQMAQLAENQMMHEFLTETLRERLDRMRSAIRGTVA